MSSSKIFTLSQGVLLLPVLLLLSMTAFARAQDPQDQTPSAPPPGQRTQRPEPLPQMPMNGGDVNRDEIIAQERAGLDALKRGDLPAFAAPITDDAVFLDANGIARKPDVLKSLADFQLKDYAISDMRFVPVSPDNGVVSYTLTETGTSHGKPFSSKLYVSSAWVKSGRQFQRVFSQQTPAK